MRRLINWFNILIKKRKALKRWQRIVTVLAAVITFATTYALILPAITVEKDNTSEVAGMYLEKSTDADGMQEDNALEPTGVTIAADMDNAVIFACSDDDMTATAVFSSDEDIPEGAELVVNLVDPESEEYADLRSRSEGLLDKEFIYDVTTCSFYDFALICDNVDVTPKTGLVDIHIIFRNNTVEHVNDMLFAGRFARPAEEVDGFMTVAADTASPVDGMSAVVNETIDTENNSNAEDELVSANSDDSSVIELADGIITSLALKGNDLARNDSIVGILAGNVDEETKAAAAETDAEIPDNDGSQEESEVSGSAETDDEEISTALPVKTLKVSGSDYTVTLSYDESSGIPDGAVLDVSEIAQDSEEYQTYLKEAKKAMGLKEEETLPSFAARFFDIKIMVRNQEFTPKTGVSVEITYNEPLAEHPDTEVSAVHFADESAKAEVIEANTAEVQDDGKATVEFTAESFSVYGVIYTVDFHWEVNGKTYDFSIPGGGFVSLEHLVEVLGIAASDENTDNVDVNSENGAEKADEFTGEEPSVEEDGKNGTAYEETIKLNQVEVSEATKKFVADVVSVEFSSPELVWVGNADEVTTVGGLKEANGLDIKYSADLTEEQIAEINAQMVKAGDWALISLLPFTTSETLTVVLNDGQVFTVAVTDAVTTNIQNGGKYIIVFPGYDKYYVLKGDGSTVPITVPGTSTLQAELDKLSDDYLWTFSHPWREYWNVTSDDGYYLTLDGAHRTAGTVVGTTPNGVAFSPLGYNNLLNGYQGVYNGYGFDWYDIGIKNDKISVLTEAEYQSDDYYTALWLYKQEDRRYNFTVKTEYNNVHRGTVTGKDKDNVQRNNMASFVAVTNTGAQNFSNRDQISATAATGYKFECWKLGDRVLTDADFIEPPVLSNGGKTSTIKAGKLVLPEDNQVLTAVFSKNPDEYGGVADYSSLIHEYMQKLKKDPLITKKTAEVYDYDNRIYQVDFEYTGDAQIITPNVELAFVTDVSRSMYFPSKLKSVKTFSKNSSSDLISQLDSLHNARKAETDSSDHDEVYYLVANPTTDATVYAVRKDGNTWKIIDASYDVRTHAKSGVGIKNNDPWYYYAESDLGKSDGHGGTYNNYNNFPYNRWYNLNDFSSSGGNLYHNSLKKSFSDLNIYIAEDHIYRLDYLQQAVDIASNTLYSQNKDAGIGLVTFAKDAESTSMYDKTQYNQLIYDLNNISPTGNTNQRKGLEEAQETYWTTTSDPNHKRVVILVTDGAPNPGTGQPNSDWSTINGSDGIATKLKNTYGATLYTVGLSVDQVSGAKLGLYNTASYVPDADGSIGTAGSRSGFGSAAADEGKYKYAFFTSDGPGLVESILQIVQSMFTQVDLYGTMRDIVDPAFYPVNSDGTPVQPGYYLANGTPITDTSTLTTLDQNQTEYYQWVREGENWKITWYNIKLKRGTKDDDGNVLVSGDRRTILIKAKEDFLGGNAINTNQGDAWAIANYYKEIVPTGQTTNIKGTLTPAVNRTMETPWVNVDELAMDQNDTEWTVYLGTNVDPKAEIQKLFEKINIREVVTRSESQAHQQGLYWANSQVMSYDPDNPSGSGTTIYNIDTSANAWQDNDQTLKNVTPASFTLDNAIRSIQRTTTGQPTLTDEQWSTLCSGGELTFKYYGDQAYGHGSVTEPVGVITLKVEKTIADGEGSIPDAHDTTVTNADNGGQPVEKYTLTATYTPEAGQIVEDWHTGNHKTGHAGMATDSMTSVNYHTINVFSKPLDILKVDKDIAAITGKPATFELLRPWAAEDTDESKKVIFGTTPGYTGYKLDGSDLTGTYYLVDTQDIDTDTGIAHFGTGTDADKLLSSAKDPYIIIEKSEPSGYAKDVNAKTITIVTDGTNMNLYSDLNKAAVNNANYPSTGNPYNWNQAVQFQVEDYNATSKMNQTSVIDYVNKDSGAEITLNQPVYTAGEPWKATGSARNPIYVFSNIENTKELIRDDTSGVGVFRFSIINEPSVIDIIIHKVDDKGVALPGATFKLVNGSQIVTVSSTGDGVVIEPKVTGETVTIKDNTFTIPSGGVTIKNLQTSDTEYAIVEVDSPEGYVITNDTPIRFKVTSGELTDKTMTTGVEYAPEGNDFTIPNTPGAALPATGGPGTSLIYFLGIILTSLAGASFMMRKRCKTW